MREREGVSGGGASDIETSLSRTPDRTMVRAARLHYEQGLTHQAIADELGLSRVKVTRLLAEARRVGVVRITVHDITRPYPEIEMNLAERLGLDLVRVAPATVGMSGQAAVAVDGGVLLAERFSVARCVAFGVSSTVADAVSHLPTSATSAALMVPMSGGWAGPQRTLNPDSSAGIAARVLGTEACAMTAPLVAADGKLARALAASPGVTSVLDLARGADTVVFGVGTTPTTSAWDQALLGRAVSAEEARELVERKVAGDISGRFFDDQGAPLQGGFDARVVGLDLDEIRRIPERIALASGTEKVAAIRSAAAGRLMSTLATDRITADALLRSLDGEAV